MKHLENESNFGFAWFLCLMAYQRSWVFHAKVILVEEHQWYYLTNSWGDKVVHNFPKVLIWKWTW